MVLYCFHLYSFKKFLIFVLIRSMANFNISKLLEMNSKQNNLPATLPKLPFQWLHVKLFLKTTNHYPLRQFHWNSSFFILILKMTYRDVFRPLPAISLECNKILAIVANYQKTNRRNSNFKFKVLENLWHNFNLELLSFHSFYFW